MSLSVEITKGRNGQDIGTLYDSEKPKFKRKVWENFKDKKRIYFYVEDGDFSLKIELRGFQDLPVELHKHGYLTSGASYYFKKKLSGLKIFKFVIDKSDVETSFRTKRNGAEICIQYNEFKCIFDELKQIKSDARQSRSQWIDSIFHSMFPETFKPLQVSYVNKKNRIMRNLDPEIVNEFTKEEVGKLFSFYQKLLMNEHASNAKKIELVKASKLKVDEIAINEIISRYNVLLEKSASEADWGKFLKENLYIVDSRYVNAISELHLTLGTSRRVDFGLVDFDGYLDIYEIKKPTTNLLSKKTDRGNYYLHSDTVKAISQAEKYLELARERAAMLEKDLLNNVNEVVKIIRPKCKLIIGSLDQLKNEKERNDFRMLKDSLKNIEIITYDEFYLKLLNLKNKKIIL